MRIAGAFIALLVAVVAIPTAVNAQLNVANIANATSMAPIPLASHPQGQAMMAQAVQRAALLDLNFTFLDKDYEDNTYATDPLGNRYITGCYKFKASSGFRLKVDVPQFTLTPQGLTITQNIAKIEANQLAVRVRAVVCQDIDAGMGILLSNVRVTYRAKPMLSFSQSNGSCTVGWSPDNDELEVHIGDLNVLGLQNNIDQLAKKAVNEALDLMLSRFYAETMKDELVKVAVGVCGQSSSSASSAATSQPVTTSQPATTRQPATRPATRQPAPRP